MWTNKLANAFPHLIPIISNLGENNNHSDHGSEGGDSQSSIESANTSGKVTQLTAEEEENLRKFRIRHLKTLVKKCCSHKVEMPRKFLEISVKLGDNPKALTEDEITALRTECFEALGSDVDRTDSESSGSDHEIPPQRKQYPEQTYMLQQPHRIKKKPNLYAVNMEILQGRHVRGHGSGQNTLYQ